MDWFWAVYWDNCHPQPFVADQFDLGGLEPAALRGGARLALGTMPSFRVSSAAYNGTPDDFLQNATGLPVFSGPLRDALEGAGIRGIQYVPVRVIRPGGEEIPGFSIAYALAVVDALDKMRSDMDLFPSDYFLPSRRGEVRAIRKAVLRASALEGLDFARLQDYPMDLYVSERFKEVFERGSFTGCSFKPRRLS